jgi:metallo-beta-lactamase family protein
MCDAGRIRHHLKNWLWSEKATVLLVGYQAQGTLGRLLVDGRTAVRIQGDDVKVRAAIQQIDLYSGHADGRELVQWIERRQPIKGALFLVHGEEQEVHALKDTLVAGGMADARVVLPEIDDVFELDAAGPRLQSQAAPRRLSPELVGRADWHNDLAQFMLDVRDEFEKAADDRSRAKLIRRLRRALDPEAPNGR